MRRINRIMGTLAIATVVAGCGGSFANVRVPGSPEQKAALGTLTFGGAAACRTQIEYVAPFSASIIDAANLCRQDEAAGVAALSAVTPIAEVVYPVAQLWLDVIAPCVNASSSPECKADWSALFNPAMCAATKGCASVFPH